jgi:gamma-glutamyl:cysteine ligase YbdK (ATP-grasp superfamily)
MSTWRSVAPTRRSRFTTCYERICPTSPPRGCRAVYVGLDTGLASVRSKIAGRLSRQGVPPALGDVDGFARELAWGRAGWVMPDAQRGWWWWWELRPHPSFGTLEVRVCDA